MQTSKAPMYVSLIGALLMAILTTVLNAIEGDGLIDAQEGVQIGIQSVAVANVWLTANVPGYEKAKVYVVAFLGVLQVLHMFIIDGIDTTEWINMGIVLLTGLGVVAVNPPPAHTVIEGYTVNRTGHTTS